jgi:hypothetical protein
MAIESVLLATSRDVCLVAMSSCWSACVLASRCRKTSRVRPISMHLSFNDRKYLSRLQLPNYVEAECSQELSKPSEHIHRRAWR